MIENKEIQEIENNVWELVYIQREDLNNFQGKLLAILSLWL